MADGNLNDEQIELLSKALTELRKSLVLSDKTQAALQAEINKDAEAFKENTEVLKENTSVGKEFVHNMSGFGSDLVDAAQQLRENRENFTSLNPAIRAAGQLVGASGKAFGSMAESVGDSVQGVAGISKGFKGFATTMVAGGLIKGIGTAFKNGSEAASQMAVAFGEFATGELQNVVESYRKVGSVGVIGAGGMTEMYDSAVKLGIGLQGFANVVSRNGQSLAYAGGSTKAGADALVGMVESSKQYEDRLLALGFTFSEMREDSAKFLERNRVLGLADINDKKKLAEANNSYMMQLDRLARMTGKSRDEIAKQLDQQMKNVRFQATQRLVIKELGDERGKQQAQVMDDVASMLSVQDPSGAMQKGFMDAISGAINTPEAKAFWNGLGEEGKRTVQGIRQGTVTNAVGAMKTIAKSVKDSYEIKGGDVVFSQIGKTEHALSTVESGLMSLSTMTDKQIESLGKVDKEQGAAASAQDEATKRAAAAQRKMQEMGQKLDEIVRKEVLPHAAEAVESFTDAISDFVDVASKALGKKRLASGSAQDGAFSKAEAAAAQPMLARAEQERNIYASKEFKEWQESKNAGSMQKGMYHEKFGVAAYMKEKGIEPATAPTTTDTTGAGPIAGSTQQVLETIKKRESSGNYQAQAPGSSASGAYQFIDSTWRSLAKKYNIGTEFARAGDAPPDVQDAIASKYVEDILKQTGGDVSKVPNVWYTGNVEGKMSDQALKANRGQTATEYQEKWLKDFNKISSAGALAGGAIAAGASPDKSKEDTTTEQSKEYARQLALVEEQKAKLEDVKARVLEARKKLAYKDPNGKVIVQQPSEPFAAAGGVFSGPKSGYSATLHGNEAVVPMPSGEIPMEMGGIDDTFDEQLALMNEQTAGLEELLRTLKAGASLSERILRVSQT